MIPNVLTWQVGTSNATFIVNAAGATSSPLAINNSTTPSFTAFGLQQRVLVTSTGNDSSIYFKIVGLNMAGFTVTDYVLGSNATFATSNLDFAKVISVQGVSSTGFGTANYNPA